MQIFPSVKGSVSTASNPSALVYSVSLCDDTFLIQTQVLKDFHDRNKRFRAEFEDSSDEFESSPFRSRITSASACAAETPPTTVTAGTSTSSAGVGNTTMNGLLEEWSPDGESASEQRDLNESGVFQQTIPSYCLPNMVS